jgi:hypothetical protein
MRFLSTTRIALAVGICALSGCGSDHPPRDGKAAMAAAALETDKERAADLIVRDVTAYLGARAEATPGGGGTTPVTDRLHAEDTALEGLFDATEALRIAASAEDMIEEYDAEAGRAARVRGSAVQVRAAAQRVEASSRALLRTVETSTPGLAAENTLESDRNVLRASLRALKVDVMAMELEGPQ